MTTPTAYPLQWPAGWPQTPVIQRQHGKFRSDTSSSLSKLRKELGLMGARDVVLSSNCTLGNDRPKDSAVCAYFTWDGAQLAIPCDRWDTVSGNVQAIALTVEAMRGMERWGAKHMIKAMFTGFKMLPSSERPWHQVLGVSADAKSAEISNAYRNLVKIHHPDASGSHDRFIEVQRAFEQARKMGLAA